MGFHSGPVLIKASKCDLARDGCRQCHRAGLSCCGYRDSTELIFRDQTSSIIRRSQYTKHQSADRVVSGVWDGRISIRQVHLAWHVRARDAFFAHYVFGLSSSYDVLGILYQSARPSGHLSASVDAASLAFMADNYPAEHVLLNLATQHYMTALRRLHVALQSPEVAFEDCTLQSVLLLDLYEKLVSRNRRSPTPWMSHIIGGTALARARGESNLQSHIGRRLSKRLYTTLLISCAVAGCHIPPGLVALRAGLERFQDPNDIKWRVTILNEEVTNFRADVIGGRYTSNSEIAANASRLDVQFEAIEALLRSDWEPRRVNALERNPKDRLSFRGTYDVYRDHIVTQVRNVIRTIRVHLHLLVQELDNPDKVSLDPNIGKASTRYYINKWCEDICASVPQFVIAGARPGNQIPFTALQAMQCRTLLAPLYLAGHVSKDPDVRPWAVHMMAYMADAGGMEAAQKIADELALGQRMEYWDVYAMLGGYAFAA